MLLMLLYFEGSSLSFYVAILDVAVSLYFKIPMSSTFCVVIFQKSCVCFNTNLLIRAGFPQLSLLIMI